MRTFTATGFHPEALRRLGRDIETARKFTSETRKDAAKSGVAMPDGSYPIFNAEDLANAVKDYVRTGRPAAVKAHIVKRARVVGGKLPDNFEDN